MSEGLSKRELGEEKKCLLSIRYAEEKETVKNVVDREINTRSDATKSYSNVCIGL